MNDYVSNSLKSYPKNNYVLGHDYIDDLIYKMVKNQSLHNSLIFSGYKGIGKATYAISFIKRILSTKRNDINEGNLVKIYDDNVNNLVNNNVHPNLLCVTPKYDEKKKSFKSNISIDETRNIIDFTHLTTIYDTYKIILIDSIDELNNNSKNALLKVLEEPPKNTLFILISHNYKNVLDTIKSRCINISFQRLSSDIITKEAEKQDGYHKIDEQNKNILFELSQGSLGRYIWLTHDNNLSIVQDLLNLITKNKSIEGIYKLLANINKVNNFDISFLLDILYSYIGNNIDLENVIELSRLLEDINNAKCYSEELHLDKNHILYSLLYRIINL